MIHCHGFRVSAFSRKTYDPTPYAALRDEPQPGQQPTTASQGPKPAVAAVAAPDETARLGELRSALWDAFASGDPLPVSLIDLVHAYAAALRLEISLKLPPRRSIGQGRAPPVGLRRD